MATISRMFQSPFALTRVAIVLVVEVSVDAGTSFGFYLTLRLPQRDRIVALQVEEPLLVHSPVCLLGIV